MLRVRSNCPWMLLFGYLGKVFVIGMKIESTIGKWDDWETKARKLGSDERRSSTVASARRLTGRLVRKAQRASLREL